MSSNVGQNPLSLLDSSGSVYIQRTHIGSNRRHTLKDIRPPMFDGGKAHIQSLCCIAVIHPFQSQFQQLLFASRQPKLRAGAALKNRRPDRKRIIAHCFRVQSHQCPLRWPRLIGIAIRRRVESLDRLERPNRASYGGVQFIHDLHKNSGKHVTAVKLPECAA